MKYKWETLEEEAELACSIDKKGVKHILRQGLPQGLSLSPLLCTLAVEQFKPPKGTFLYVDDGLFIGDREGLKEFFMFIQEIMYAGAVIAPDKSGYVKEKVKFVGIIIDIKNRTLKFPSGKVTSWRKDLSGILRDIKKHCSQLYVPEAKKVTS